MNFSKLFGLLAIVTVCVPLWAHAEVVDAVLATVDSDPILQSDLMYAITPVLTDMRRQGASDEEIARRGNALMREQLDVQIDQKILIREALLLGIEPNEDWVDERLVSLEDDFGGAEELRKYLENTGETLTELRERWRLRYLAWHMENAKLRMFEQEVVVSEEQLRAYFEKHKDEFVEEEEVHVSTIFLMAPKDKAKREAVRKKMEAIRDELVGGADFAEVAKEYSEAPGAEDGGVVGWQKRGDLQQALDEVVFALKPGETSDIIETTYGFNIMHVDERKEAGAIELKDFRSRIEPLIRKEEGLAAYRKWLDELRKRSRVRIFM